MALESRDDNYQSYEERLSGPPDRTMFMSDTTTPTTGSISTLLPHESHHRPRSREGYRTGESRHPASGASEVDVIISGGRERNRYYRDPSYYERDRSQTRYEKAVPDRPSLVYHEPKSGGRASHVIHAAEVGGRSSHISSEAPSGGRSSNYAYEPAFGARPSRSISDAAPYTKPFDMTFPSQESRYLALELSAARRRYDAGDVADRREGSRFVVEYYPDRREGSRYVVEQAPDRREGSRFVVEEAEERRAASRYMVEENPERRQGSRYMVEEGPSVQSVSSRAYPPTAWRSRDDAYTNRERHREPSLERVTVHQERQVGVFFKDIEAQIRELSSMCRRLTSVSGRQTETEWRGLEMDALRLLEKLRKGRANDTLFGGGPGDLDAAERDLAFIFSQCRYAYSGERPAAASRDQYVVLRNREGGYAGIERR